MSGNEFFNRIDALSTGERAVMKRNCGVMLDEADGKALITFYRCLPHSVPQWQEPYYFAVGCIACLWKEKGTVSLEECFAQLRDNSGSIEKRITTLLDMDWDNDGFFLTKLTRLIKMAASAGYKIDCEKLLNDLLWWNSDSRFVQKNWARKLYIRETTEKKEGE